MKTDNKYEKDLVFTWVLPKIEEVVNFLNLWLSAGLCLLMDNEKQI